MSLVPAEFIIADVYFSPLLIAGIFGAVAAWITAHLLNRFRLSRFFAYPPLVMLSMAVIYTLLIGTFVIPV